MVEKNLAQVRLFRFDPGLDNHPWYQDFEAPYEGRSVLDTLQYIYENLDSSFAFRWACQQGCCRGCVMLVNGTPVFACRKSAEKVMVIEPHPKFEILKDLVVDFDRLKTRPL